MSSTLPSASSCCDPDCTPVTVDIPGSPGAPGADGADGADGQSAFTLTGESFTMPAEGATAASLLVGNSDFMAVNEFVFMQGIGTLQVTAIVDSTHVTLKNPADTASGLYTGNSAPGTVASSGTRLVPAGQQGPAGASGDTPAIDAISPTTSKGDILVDNGANNPTASVVRKAAGADGTVLVSDSAQLDGRKQVALTPNAATDNVIPRFDASGDTTPTPLQSSGMTVTDDGALQSTGGNARGSKAVDLQVDRANAAQVASGAASVIGGGDTNKASGDNSVVAGGTGNSATSDNSVVSGGSNNSATNVGAVCAGGNANTVSNQFAVSSGGASNTISGLEAVVVGGDNNQASGANSTVLNGQSNVASKPFTHISNGVAARADKYGQHVHNNGTFGGSACQVSELIWRVTTTDATANVEAFLDGSTATERASVPTNTTWAFSILVSARKSDGTSACWKVEGGIKNDAGNVVLVAAVTTTVIADGTGATWGVAGGVVVDADNTNDTLRVSVTGAAASTIRWTIHGRIVETGY